MGAGEVFKGTVAGPVVDGAPCVFKGIVGAGAGGLGAPPAVGAGGGVGAEGAVLRGIVGAGAGGFGAPAVGAGAGGAGAAEGSAFKVTRTVSFFNGTADVFFIGVGGLGG